MFIGPTCTKMTLYALCEVMVGRVRSTPAYAVTEISWEIAKVME